MNNKKWTIDPAHTNIQFKAKHLMITTVTGNFSSFNGSVETEGNDFSSGKFSFTADVNSISTGNVDRDHHLKGDDFFNVESFPHLTFVGSEIANVEGDDFELHGEMTIRDVTMPAVLNVEIGGVAVDPWGNTKAGFSFKTKLNRKDFGLKFHVVNEAGNLLVSDEIKIEGEVQLAVVESVEA
jgi:polyisoprenoid-binding protein YceI